MKPANEYPVTFGWNAQDGVYYGPNGSVGLYHKGRDRSMPTGTPIVIGTKTIGKSGNTGASSGPHLHIGAYPESTGVTVDPTPYEFKPGVVHSVGENSTNGKYIRIKVDGTDKLAIYLHLYEILVKVGDKIGGTMAKFDKTSIDRFFKLAKNRLPDQATYDYPELKQEVTLENLKAIQLKMLDRSRNQPDGVINMLEADAIELDAGKVLKIKAKEQL